MDDRKDRKELMLATLATGATWEEAAKRVGVSERTLYRWCAADEQLAALATEARDRADDQVEAVTFQKCLDPDPANNTLRMFWLKSRRPEVYRDKLHADITSGNRPLGWPTIVEVIQPRGSVDGEG
jgi:transposase-like protein